MFGAFEYCTSCVLRGDLARYMLLVSHAVGEDRRESVLANVTGGLCAEVVFESIRSLNALLLIEEGHGRFKELPHLLHKPFHSVLPHLRHVHHLELRECGYDGVAK